VLRGSGAIEDGLLAGRKEPEGVPGVLLDELDVDEEGAGGAARAIGGLAAHVDEEGAPGTDGLEGGGGLDARRVTVVE
jgi:hypothetical protein